MKYIVIHTQNLENYGINCDGTADIWKFKGGNTYLVTAPRLASAIAEVQFNLLKNTTEYVSAHHEFETLAEAKDFLNATCGHQVVIGATAYFEKSNQ